MSKQFAQAIRIPSTRSILAPTLRLTTPLIKTSFTPAANQYRTFQSSIPINFRSTTIKMAGTQPASGGEQRDFARDTLFDLKGKVALVTGTCDSTIRLWNIVTHQL